MGKELPALDLTRLPLQFALLTLSFVAVAALGCAGSSGNSDSTGELDLPSSEEGGDGDDSASGSPLRVVVSTRFEDNSTPAQVAECAFLSTDAPLGPAKTCTISIPELVLYFSDLIFEVSTQSRLTCTNITFTPFSYARSVSAGFVNDRAVTVDCSEPLYQRSADCYGGAAKDIVPGFPLNQSVYFLTANELQQSYRLQASSTRRDTDPDRSMFTNANAANNLASGSRGSAISNAFVRYVANSMQDYQFVCYDNFANINYQINLIIEDLDEVNQETNAPLDFFWDWRL